MDTYIFVAVLLAAVLHASWNALVKSGADKQSSVVAVMFGHVPPALLCFAFVPFPSADVWHLIVLSAGFHIAYPMALQKGYQTGDLGQVYPIARGTAPLIVTAVSVFALGAVFNGWEFLAVLLMIGGILSMGLAHRKLGPSSDQATFWAVLTGCFIAGYSIIDGMGARISQNPLGFFSASCLVSASIFFLRSLIWRRRNITDLAGPTFKSFAIGGAASFTAYVIVVWAFTQAPIALVTALRETSMIVAVIIGVIFFGERFTRTKIFAVGVTLCGVALLKLA